MGFSAITRGVLVVSALALSCVAHAETIKPITPDSDTIKWRDAIGLPKGAKVAILTGNPEKNEFYVARLKLPANYEVPVHFHPKNEYDTVISGTYYFGTGDKADNQEGTALPSGSFVMFPAKTHHYGWTKEETVLEISGIGPWGTIHPKKSA